MSLSVAFVSLVYLVPRSISYCVRASVFFYLTQSRKRVYADHAVQVRVAARVSAVSIVSLSRKIQVDFSSCHYRVAIGHTTNCLRHWYVHNIRRIAAAKSCASLDDLTFKFAVACRLTCVQRPVEMWYPTLQAMIGKLYVLSRFYNMYVIPHPLRIMFTTVLSDLQQCSSSAYCQWRARATVDTHTYLHGACTPRGEQSHTQRPRSRFLWPYRQCTAISISVGG